MIFLFYNLPVCNKKAEILLLATAFIANLRSPFSHVFELLILCHVLKPILSAKTGLKLSYFYKNCKISELWRLRPKTPLPPAVGSVAPNPPMASGI